MIKGAIQDLQFAVRVSLRRPLPALMAVLILALGIGVNIAVFGIVNAALLKPLPIDRPGEVVALYVTDEGDEDPYGGHAHADFADLREYAAEAVDLCAIEEGVSIQMGTGEGAVLVPGGLVSGNYFAMLGVSAAQGRVLMASDDIDRNGHPVVVISHRCWRARFGGDEHIIGREIILNGHPFEVIGVAEEGFDGTRQNRLVEMWATMSMIDQVFPEMTQWFSAFGDILETRTISWMEVIGRMREGVTIEQVRQTIDAGYQRIADVDPRRASYRCTALPIGQTTIEPSQRGGISLWLRLLLLAVGLLMVIACSNVASLQLARLSGRQREIAVRMSLGAGRWRLVRQLLTESLLLATAGALIGLLAAQWLGDTFAALLAQEGTYAAEALRMDLDWRIVAFTIGLALATSILSGLVPALLAIRRPPLAALKNERSVDRGGGLARGLSLQNLLVSGQVGVSFVLVISASLVIVSLVRLQRVALGFNPQGVLAATMDLSRVGVDEGRGKQVFDQIVRGLREAPGVVNASHAQHVPISGAVWTSTINVPGYEPADDEEPFTQMNMVDGEFFNTLGIPLLRGRSFDESDHADAAPVAIISQAMADRYWRGVDPVGREFAFGSEFEEPVTVIGVVADTKYNSFREESVPYSYFPRAQRYQASAEIIVRTAGDPYAALPVIRHVVSSVDPSLPIFDIRSLEEQHRDALARERLTATLFSGFGATALLLVLAGIYGVLSYNVTQRVREIGIRMAIGAGRRDVMRQILIRGLRITGAGLAMGVVASLFVTRLLREQLFEIRPADPWVMAGVAMALLAAGLLACWLPARRATRIDPMIALRSE